MADEKKIVTPHELAAQGDPDAQEYLRWVKLKRRKEELLNKLSTTAGVDQKFRDPEFTKAQAEYYGSPSDIARRALESTAMAGNVLKAAVKTPTGTSSSRMGQVVNAIKATTGLPEDAFRENRIEGSDFTDNSTLASAIDIGADLVGGAAVAAGTKALAGKLTKGAAQVANKIIPKTSEIKKQLGSLDMPNAKVLEPENTALFQQLEDQQLNNKLRINQELVDVEEQQAIEKAFDIANPVIPESAPVSLVDDTPMKFGLDTMDIPEIAVPAMPKQLSKTPLEAEAFRKRPEFTAVDPEPKSMLEKADLSKLQKEIADSDFMKSQDLMERLSQASDSMPSIDERATEILNERLMKSSDPIPVEIFPNRGAKFFGPEAPVKSNYGTKVLEPNAPITADRLLKGLETYGTSSSSKLTTEQAVKLKQMLNASKKGKK